MNSFLTTFVTLITISATLSTASAQSIPNFSATLVSKSSNLPNTPGAPNDCPSPLNLTNLSDGKIVVMSSVNDKGESYPVQNFLNINQGVVCEKNNSSHTFGGYQCEESKLKSNVNAATLSNNACSTELLSIKCNPNKKRQHVYNLSVLADGMVIVEKEDDYYTGQRFLTTCTYKIK